MSKQPDALAFAESLERLHTHSMAGELRRLHALNLELVEELAVCRARADQAPAPGAVEIEFPEPIAEIGPDYSLRFVGAEPIATLLARHPGTRVGTYLVTVSEAQAYAQGQFHAGWRIASAKSQAPAVAHDVSGFTDAHACYVARWGGSCRDCADENGVCPNSGLPCGGADKAISHVFKALAYGVKHGYISNPLGTQAQSGWRPIETAPKDGSMFLCWVRAVRYGETDEGQQYQEDASQVDFCWWRDGVDGNGYFDPACGQIGDGQDVTHWMPLPAPPESKPPVQRTTEQQP